MRALIVFHSLVKKNVYRVEQNHNMIVDPVDPIVRRKKKSIKITERRK